MADISKVKIRLNNGVEIPIVGTGAYAPPEARAKAKHWLIGALKNGYRHIDTAYVYGTEGVVGDAIRESGIPREEIFVTTKLSWEQHDRVPWAFEKSLKNLGLDYVDLYLIHWPQAVVYEEGVLLPKNTDGTAKINSNVTFKDSWAELEKILESGKAKAIGVSNFSIKTLEELLPTAKVVPAINQVELHPYLSQEPLREYCAKKGIVLAAYTPSGYGKVRNDPTIVELAQKYGVTANQITLSWHLARGNVFIPKSEDPQRQRENITLVKLAPEDVERINGLDRDQRICNNPDEKGLVWGVSAEFLGWAKPSKL